MLSIVSDLIYRSRNITDPYIREMFIDEFNRLLTDDTPDRFTSLNCKCTSDQCAVRIVRQMKLLKNGMYISNDSKTKELAPKWNATYKILRAMIIA